MKKGVIIGISAAAALVIAACVLFLTGVLEFPFQKKEPAQKTPYMYVEYMDSCMLIDKDGYVIGSSAEVPADIPKINGITFSTIIVGEQLVPANEDAYAYAKKIVDSLNKNALTMHEVYISSDLEATMYINNVRILLGIDNKTEDKLHDLRDFYDDVKDLSGTLDMLELSHNNSGYSLKPN